MSGNHPDELNARFEQAVESLLARIYTTLLAEWHQHELTLLQARAIDVLLHHGAMRVSEISARLNHNLSATSNLVDRLVDRDIIQRTNDPRDRRAVVCELSETGRMLARKIQATAEQTLLLIAQQLDENEMETIVTALERLNQTNACETE